MVHTMLLESAETDDPSHFRTTDLYRQCVAAGVIPADEGDLDRIRNQEDNTAAERLAPSVGKRADTEETASLTLNLKVAGMWCPACAWVIERTLVRLEGVQAARCHFSTDRLRCRYRPDQVAPDQLRDALNRLGYEIREAGSGESGRRTTRKELVRLAITALLSANVMMLSWSLYAGFFTTLSTDAVFKISLPIVCMALVVFIYGGGPMLRKAWFGLIRGVPGMETLVSLGAGCALVYSLFNWLNGSIHLYFDTACMLITLVLLGKFLEQQARSRVRRDLDSFFALQPNKVRLLSDRWPKGRYVTIEQLNPGDRFAAQGTEIIPADGVVESGSATVDESSLTGEPRPVRVGRGDTVKNGTRIIDGRIIAATEKVGLDTILGRMIAVMSRSLEQKSAFESKTDQMLRWFVPIIVGLAIITGLVCLVSGVSVNQAVVRAVTVMVISCPCALGVAIPMARLAGISLAGRNGILVRDIEAFERAVTVDTVVFDKTGTLTQGRWELNRVACQPGYAVEEVVALAAGLEQTVDHEIARSIMTFSAQQGIDPATLTDVAVFPNGLQGRQGEATLRIGSRAFAWKEAPCSALGGQSDQMLTSRVFFSVDNQPAAVFIFSDAIRPAVPTLVKTLEPTIGSLHLVSGDGEAVTQAVAGSIGIKHVRYGLMPVDKADYVQMLTDRSQRVAMVGDGVNDGAAMARAHLAVAVHSGQGLAKEAAHVTFMRGDPAQLLDFLPLSRRVNQTVHQNLWCAWFYNLIAIPVAMSGLLTPLIAATAMLLSSLTVIGNTLLLVRRDGSSFRPF